MILRGCACAGVLACSLTLFSIVQADSVPGRALSDAEAARLFGGEESTCEDWDPATCSGTASGCATKTQWKARTNGPTSGKNSQNYVCGSQNCGSVLQIDKCDAM